VIFISIWLKGYYNANKQNGICYKLVQAKKWISIHTFVKPELPPVPLILLNLYCPHDLTVWKQATFRYTVEAGQAKILQDCCGVPGNKRATVLITIPWLHVSFSSKLSESPNFLFYYVIIISKLFQCNKWTFSNSVALSPPSRISSRVVFGICTFAVIKDIARIFQ